MIVSQVVLRMLSVGILLVPVVVFHYSLVKHIGRNHKNEHVFVTDVGGCRQSILK